MAKISQREARRLKKRVTDLERVQAQQRDRWVEPWPAGTILGSVQRERDWLTGRIQAARLLKHAVVVTESDNGNLTFHACPIAEAK